MRTSSNDELKTHWNTFRRSSSGNHWKVALFLSKSVKYPDRPHEDPKKEDPPFYLISDAFSHHWQWLNTMLTCNTFLNDVFLSNLLSFMFFTWDGHLPSYSSQKCDKNRLFCTSTTWKVTNLLAIGIHVVTLSVADVFGSPKWDGYSLLSHTNLFDSFFADSWSTLYYFCYFVKEWYVTAHLCGNIGSLSSQYAPKSFYLLQRWWVYWWLLTPGKPTKKLLLML